MAITTAQSKIRYGWETVAYLTKSTALTKNFGRDVEINWTSNNNFIKQRGIGTRNAATATPGVFEGSGTIDFTLASPWIFRAVLGATPADAGATPFTHTYNESDTLTPFSIEVGLPTGTASIRSLLGCIVNSFTLSGNVGEDIKSSIDFMYGWETEATSSVTGVNETFTPYFFETGTLTIGSVVTPLQSFNLTITNATELVHGIGSRKAKGFIAKERDYELSFTVAYEGNDWIENLFGKTGEPLDGYVPVASSAVTLVFTNGKTGIDKRAITITLANLYFDEASLGLRGTERVDEEISAFALSCTSVVAEDSTENSL